MSRSMTNGLHFLGNVDASAEDNRYAAKVAGFSLTKVGNHSSNGDLVREVMCGLTTDVDG